MFAPSPTSTTIEKKDLRRIIEKVLLEDGHFKREDLLSITINMVKPFVISAGIDWKAQKEDVMQAILEVMQSLTSDSQDDLGEQGHQSPNGQDSIPDVDHRSTPQWNVLPDDVKSRLMEVIWAKNPAAGPPWWPGVIFHPAFASPKIRKMALAKCNKSYLVYFFAGGSTPWQFIPWNQCKPFDPDEMATYGKTMDKKGKGLSKSVLSKFEEAINEASKEYSLLPADRLSSLFTNRSQIKESENDSEDTAQINVQLKKQENAPESAETATRAVQGKNKLKPKDDVRVDEPITKESNPVTEDEDDDKEEVFDDDDDVEYDDHRPLKKAKNSDPAPRKKREVAVAPKRPRPVTKPVVVKPLRKDDIHDSTTDAQKGLPDFFSDLTGALGPRDALFPSPSEESLAMASKALKGLWRMDAVADVVLQANAIGLLNLLKTLRKKHPNEKISAQADSIYKKWSAGIDVPTKQTTGSLPSTELKNVSQNTATTVSVQPSISLPSNPLSRDLPVAEETLPKLRLAQVSTPAQVVDDKLREKVRGALRKKNVAEDKVVILERILNEAAADNRERFKELTRLLAKKMDDDVNFLVQLNDGSVPPEDIVKMALV